jgi:hypothetical protein
MESHLKIEEKKLNYVINTVHMYTAGVVLAKA